LEKNEGQIPAMDHQQNGAFEAGSTLLGPPGNGPSERMGSVLESIEINA